MNKYLIATALIFTLLSIASPVLAIDNVTPARVSIPVATPWVEDGVFTGGQMPDWVTVCETTNIYGNPQGRGTVLGVVQSGEVVRVHDTNQNNTWVMIKSARWISMSVVCDW